jgi:ribosomal protein L32
MPRQPSREKTARHRLRQAGSLPQLPTCPDCGCSVVGVRSLPLCSQCWKLTPVGREWNRERVARQRRKRDDS